VKKKRKYRRKDKDKPAPFFTKPLLHDGILKEIYLKFFKIVADNVELPEELNTHHRRLDIVLGEGTRWTQEYRLTEDIVKMPGWWFIRDDRAQITTGPRFYPKGAKLLLIYDEERKSELIIEVFESWFKDESNKFRLTPEDFRSIIDKLEKVKDK